jgi:hypothetical protein
MSGAVDNELLRDESKDFHEHIEICGSCRDEYELERITKAYLKRKITFVDVPYDVEQAIMEQLSSQSKAGKSEGFFSRLFGNRFFQPVMAVGATLVIGIALFFANKSNVIIPALQNGTEAAQHTQQDVLALAETNFQDVLSGTFKPQITALATSDVASYINQNAGYTMNLPAVASADWIGGTVSTYDGSKFPQIVYKMGDDYIYICSFPKSSLDSKRISIPGYCSKAIESNGYYWGENSNGDAQAAWNNANHVCIATSNLEKSELIAYLKPQPSTNRQNP